MELRRLYTNGAVSGVEVFSTGLTAEQNFSRRQVMQYASEGWMSLNGDTLTLNAKNVALEYAIKRHPGYYVRSTGERIPVSELALQQFMTEPVATLAAAEARAFLAGRGLDATDYEASRNYACELRADLHEKWRAVRDIAGNLVAAHTLEG